MIENRISYKFKFDADNKLQNWSMRNLVSPANKMYSFENYGLHQGVIKTETNPRIQWKLNVWLEGMPVFQFGENFAFKNSIIF